MEVKGSEAQGRRREAGSEGSVEQRYGPMDKNRIRGLRRRTSEQLTAKSVSIKDAGGKSGGRVSKAVELIAGDLLHVSDSGLRVEQFALILQQKSAAGVVLTEVRKAQTVRASSRTSNSRAALRPRLWQGRVGDHSPYADFALYPSSLWGARVEVRPC